jgi:hypothetical protein
LDRSLSFWEVCRGGKPLFTFLHELPGAPQSGRFGGLQALQDILFSLVLGGFAAENQRKSEI